MEAGTETVETAVAAAPVPVKKAKKRKHRRTAAKAAAPAPTPPAPKKVTDALDVIREKIVAQITVKAQQKAALERALAELQATG